MSCLEPLGECRDVEWCPNLTENMVNVERIWAAGSQKGLKSVIWMAYFTLGRVSSHNLQMKIWNLVGSCVSVEWKKTPTYTPQNFQGTKWSLDIYLEFLFTFTRELTYFTLGKGSSSTQTCLFGGSVGIWTTGKFSPAQKSPWENLNLFTIENAEEISSDTVELGTMFLALWIHWHQCVLTFWWFGRVGVFRDESLRKKPTQKTKSL